MPSTKADLHPSLWTDVPRRLLLAMLLCETEFARLSIFWTYQQLQLGWSPLDLHPHDYERYVATHDGETPWLRRLSGHLLTQLEPKGVDRRPRPPVRDRAPPVAATTTSTATTNSTNAAVRSPNGMLTPDRFA